MLKVKKGSFLLKPVLESGWLVKDRVVCMDCRPGACFLKDSVGKCG